MTNPDDNPHLRPDRLDALKAKKAAIDAQIARLNSAAAKDKRKREDRMKFLVGAVILREATRDPKVADWLRLQLMRGLTQARDRAVFNLPSLPEKNSPTDGTDVCPSDER